MDPQSAIADITAEEAFTLIHALRSKFGWVGTEFTPDDVREAARTALADDEDATVDEQEVERITQIVVGAYSYRTMADRLAERGNEMLADAVSMAIAGYTD